MLNNELISESKKFLLILKVLEKDALKILGILTLKDQKKLDSLLEAYDVYLNSSK